MKSEFFTTSDGVKLHYLESGAGPTILFVPGWTMPAEIWQPQIEYFSKNYHVVAVDPRSQGASDKPAEGNYPGRRAQDYKELIDHLGGSPVVLAGWSLAVHEALTYVQMFGTYKLNGLVLGGSGHLHHIDPGRTQRPLRTCCTLFRLTGSNTRKPSVRGMYHKPQSEEYLKSVIEASLKTPTSTGIALIGELAVKYDERPALPKLNIPVLAVMTKNNRAAAELIASTVPGGQGEVFEDAGHCLFVDDADRFNTLLVGFLQKASQGAGK